MSPSYFDVYMTQLFTTLGQLSAVVLSGTLAVPLYSYYSKRVEYFVNNYRKKYE